MGAFFSNVLIYRDDLAEADALEHVEAALEAHLSEAGYHLIDDAAGPADRTVLLTAEGPWIVAYDETTDRDPTSLEALASDLSRAAGGFAIAVNVHDSDVLLLSLWRDGKVQDRFDSAPDYFADISEREAAKLAGRAKRWAKILVDSEQVKQLQAAFQKKETFAEHTLAAIGPLLGVTPSRLCRGYRYALKEEAAEQRAGLQALRFRRGEPELDNDSPVDFRLGRSTKHAAAQIGGTLQLALAAVNVGGSAQGVQLEVWGPAVEAGLLRPIKATLQQYKSGLFTEELEGEPLEATFRPIEDGTAHIAEFSDFTLRGVLLKQVKGREQRRVAPNFFEATALVECLKAGELAVHFSYRCMTQRKAQIGKAIPVTVSDNSPATN